MLASPGSSAELYGWETVRRKPPRLVICEGEFDRLVMEGLGFPAVTSTAGALTFKREWAESLTAIPEIYVCFDRDAAGRQGAERVAKLLPHARIVKLPDEVGEKGDVTDFFVRLGRTPENFEALLRAARPLPVREPSLVRPLPGEGGKTSIEEVVRRYSALRAAGRNLAGRCPFHDDRHPSMVVFLERGTFRCFACGARGDALGFLCRIHGLSIEGLVERLKSREHE
jgi:DNA primase